MQHLITPDQDILGFDGQQFIFAESLKQSVNIALIGVPGSGKTSCLTFHVAQAVCRNAIVRGWDLHGDVVADLGDCFHILEDVEEILDDCTWLQGERDRRLALRRSAKSGDRSALKQWNETRELFYIVDELNALMLRLKQRKADRELVADTLLSLVAEGRKFKMRVIITGQTMPAALFGEGGSSARDIINTKYAFQSRESQAQYFGIEQKAIEKLLPLISGRDSAGYAILDGGPLLHAIIVSIPYTTVKDIRALLERKEEYRYEAERSTENRRVPVEPEEHTAPKKIYHTHDGIDQLSRTRAREMRLRESSAQIRPTNQPVTEQDSNIRTLLAYRKPEPPPAAPEREITLQEAYQSWSNGNDSIRDLAKALVITEYQAYKLYRAMIKAQLIEPKKKMVVRE